MFLKLRRANGAFYVNASMIYQIYYTVYSFTDKSDYLQFSFKKKKNGGGGGG